MEYVSLISGVNISHQRITKRKPISNPLIIKRVESMRYAHGVNLLFKLLAV